MTKKKDSRDGIKIGNPMTVTVKIATSIDEITLYTLYGFAISIKTNMDAKFKDKIPIAIPLLVNPKTPKIYGITADNAKNIPAGTEVLITFLRKDPDIFCEKGSIAKRTDPNPATHKDIPSMF